MVTVTSVLIGLGIAALIFVVTAAIVGALDLSQGMGWMMYSGMTIAAIYGLGTYTTLPSTVTTIIFAAPVTLFALLLLMVGWRWFSHMRHVTVEGEAREWLNELQEDEEFVTAANKLRPMDIKEETIIAETKDELHDRVIMRADE